MYVQEKWRLRQEETRLRAGQSSLEQERLRLTEITQRERLNLEAAKVSVVCFVAALSHQLLPSQDYARLSDEVLV